MRKYNLILLFIVLFSCDSKEIMDNKSSQASLNTQFENPVHNQFALDIEHYVNSVNNEHWEEVITTTYPLVYGNKENKEVIADFIQAKSFGIDRSIKLNKIEKISPIIEDAQNHYAKIYLNALISFDLSGQALERKDLMQTNVELSYDTPDVAFNPKKNTLTVDAYYPMIAISKKGSNIWKYVEVDKQKEPYYSQIIPQNILDQLD